MAWRLARSLGVLHQQIKAAYPTAAPPNTSVTSWGTIGDRVHSPASDHSPKVFSGWASEIVTAIDFPHRPDLKLNTGVVVEAMRLSRDPRIKYVIFNRRIYSSYATSGRAAWVWGPYSKASVEPHDTHAHVSSVGDSRADQTHKWKIGPEMPDISANETPNAWTAAARMDALLRGAKEYRVNWGTGPVTETNAVAVALERIEQALAAPQPVTLAPEQLAVLADLIAARVGPIVDQQLDQAFGGAVDKD